MVRLPTHPTHPLSISPDHLESAWIGLERRSGFCLYLTRIVIKNAQIYWEQDARLPSDRPLDWVFHKDRASFFNLEPQKSTAAAAVSHSLWLGGNGNPVLAVFQHETQLR